MNSAIKLINFVNTGVIAEFDVSVDDVEMKFQALCSLVPKYVVKEGIEVIQILTILRAPL